MPYATFGAHFFHPARSLERPQGAALIHGSMPKWDLGDRALQKRPPGFSVVRGSIRGVRNTVSGSWSHLSLRLSAGV